MEVVDGLSAAATVVHHQAKALLEPAVPRQSVGRGENPRDQVGVLGPDLDHPGHVPARDDQEVGRRLRLQVFDDDHLFVPVDHRGGGLPGDDLAEDAVLVHQFVLPSTVGGGGAKVNMPRAILFDFDGTLVLSEPLHFRAFAGVLRRRGIRLSESDYAERYLGLTDRECVERMIEDLSLRGPGDSAARLLAEKAEAIEAEIVRGVPLCPGVETFVATAAEHCALAVVSCGLRREIHALLSRTKLEGFFSVVVSAEDVRVGKPDPEGYRLGWRRLRRSGLLDLAPADCLVVEDSPRGIAAALAAGMRVIALPHTCPAEELVAADRVVESYSEVSWRDLERLFAAREPGGSARADRPRPLT